MPQIEEVEELPKAMFYESLSQSKGTFTAALAMNPNALAMDEPTKLVDKQGLTQFTVSDCVSIYEPIVTTRSTWYVVPVKAMSFDCNETNILGSSSTQNEGEVCSVPEVGSVWVACNTYEGDSPHAGVCVYDEI